MSLVMIEKKLLRYFVTCANSYIASSKPDSVNNSYGRSSRNF